MVKNVFILDEHLKTDKVLTINGKNAFFDDLYTLDLSTGAETYEFSTAITEINESNYVMFYYHGKYKLFQIVEIEQEHAEGKIITTVYAETACLELLNNVVRSFEGEYNAISFLEHVLEGSEWAIGEYSSSLAEKVVSVKVDKTTQKWSCIQDYMGNFGYEISPRVIYNNGHVKAKLIDVYSEGGLGNHTYKRFEYGYNVIGMVKKKDLYEWCTALIIDTDKDVTNVEYNEGEYIKKAGSDVVLAANENRKYNLGRDYIYSNFEAKDCNDATDAVVKAIEELKRRATPRFDYECTTALTYEEYDNLNLGDTVYCIDHTFSPSLTLEARVGKLELSFTDRTKCRCTLTNYKEVKSKINMELTGTIQQIVGSYFPITSDGIANGAITDGKIETTYYQQITADIVSASKVVTEELIAKKIIAIDGKFENLETIYAKIENLDATNANITNLTANVATIQTLINGHLTSDNIQSLILTSDKVTIANALIKDAHIESINASKVNAGILNTNNVSIQSNDGSMLLQGNLQQFKDKDGNVRIQIGKDATGNFTFSLFDASGTGVLIDETGIKSGAVGNGLIVNAMISDNANISGGKLDISSVISSINDNENTLLSSKIKFSDTDQTLDVAFNQLKTKVETIENVTVGGDLSGVIEQVNTNTTNISIAQGQISSLISNTTITKQNGTVVQLKDEYNSTKDTVNSHTTKIGSLETNYDTISGQVSGVISKQASLEQSLNGFKTTVTSNYAKLSDVNNLKGEINSSISQVEQTANKINWLVQSGTSSSNMQLTANAYNLISKNINLEGYTTINGGFKIDLQGNMEAKNGTFSGTITGSTLSTTATNNKYVEVKTSDYSVFNSSKKVISIGLRDLTYSNSTTGSSTTTTDTPCIYIGADGFNSSGGTSYTGRTGRYYGMIQSYNHLNSLSSSYEGYYQVPYLNFRYNTSYSTDSGGPATSNIRMFANGDIMLAPVKNLIIKTNRTNGAISSDGTTEYEIAKFFSANSSYYDSGMEIRAVINKKSGAGLCIGHLDDANSRSAYFYATVGDTTDGGTYRTWKPHSDAKAWLGTGTYRWKTLYLSGSTVQTSDRRSKENIEYITNVSNPKAKISSTYTSEDICSFVKNIPYATFNMIEDEDKEKRIGFILQDIVDNDICRDLILDKETLKIEQGTETDTQPYMGFNQANYISMLGLALQEEIKKREALEDKLTEILSKIDGLNEG